MSINTVRHKELFDPEKWGATPIAVVGCGGIGSHLTWHLARLGVRRLVLFDDDVVADHNLANQVFGRRDTGTPKVRALAHALRRELGTSVRTVVRQVARRQKLAPVVFLAVDSMAARKTIMETCVFGHQDVLYVFDGRMDASHGVVYSLNPNNAEHVATWQHYWFPDTDAENAGPACGGHVSVCYAASITASLMAHEFVRWVASCEHGGSQPANQRWIDLNSDSMRAARW